MPVYICKRKKYLLTYNDKRVGLIFINGQKMVIGGVRFKNELLKRVSSITENYAKLLKQCCPARNKVRFTFRLKQGFSENDIINEIMATECIVHEVRGFGRLMR